MQPHAAVLRLRFAGDFVVFLTPSVGLRRLYSKCSDVNKQIHIDDPGAFGRLRPSTERIKFTRDPELDLLDPVPNFVRRSDAQA